jgi:hypothetical protein
MLYYESKRLQIAVVAAANEDCKTLRQRQTWERISPKTLSV